MDKLKLHSPDLTAGNIAKIAALFPNCVTEAKGEGDSLKPAIDFDLLRQELSADLVEGPQERYRLDWPGKREALATANAPIAKTLRPCREESVDFDTTKNLYIEGDNLEVLKLLQETYLEKVTIIYIDPPYNTGSDLIYEDDFAESSENYFERSNQTDEAGNRLVANTDANGRFHSEWVSMIYMRLKIARNLLNEKGVCFISIGNHEIENLKHLANEIFGAKNFIALIPRVMKSGGAKGQFFSPSVDFILVYAKDKTITSPFRTKITQDQIDGYYRFVQRDGTRKGEHYGEERVFVSGLDPLRGCKNQRYWVECPDGSFIIPPGENFPSRVKDGEKIAPTAEDRVWKWTHARLNEERSNGDLVFKETDRSPLVTAEGKRSRYNLYNKLWLNEQMEKGKVPADYFDKFENRQSSAELKELNIPFEFAKPVSLISFLTEISRSDSDDVVLDFFSGSATTAHAVMKLNAEDGNKRRHIMVQLPETCEADSEAYKAGFSTITELGKERIRRAGAKIRTELESQLDGELPGSDKHEEITTKLANLDTGFRVLKVDTSNMANVYYRPDEITQDGLDMQVENIKPDRSPEDLLFQVLLDWGVDLALPIE